MATFTITLDDNTLRRLTDAAAQVGVTSERLAEMMLESLLFDRVEVAQASAGVGEPSHAWTDETAEVSGASDRSPRLTNAGNYDAPFVDLNRALDNFSADLRRRRKISAG